MSEVTKPRSGLGARLGQGQAQAATLEPSMVLHLLGTLELTIADPHWPLIFCAYAMCFGVVRHAHLQSSYLVGGNGGILVFWCTKGKTGSRGGFAWSVPRYCGTLDLLQVLGSHLNKVRPHSGPAFRRWHWLGFDSATAQPVDTPQFIRILRPHFSAAMDTTSLSSYSFRRVLPTLAGYVELSETEKLALGQWTDQSSKTTATTPLRYDSQGCTFSMTSTWLSGTNFLWGTLILKAIVELMLSIFVLRFLRFGHTMRPKLNNWSC